MNASITRSALLLATVLTLGYTRAAEPPAPADPLRASVLSPQERELKTQINRYITYPLAERTSRMDGEVLVTFVINTAGKVEVIDAVSENPALRTYVLDRLEKIDIGENPTGTWRTEHVRFVFRPEA